MYHFHGSKTTYSEIKHIKSTWTFDYLVGYSLRQDLVLISALSEVVNPVTEAAELSLDPRNEDPSEHKAETIAEYNFRARTTYAPFQTILRIIPSFIYADIQYLLEARAKAPSKLIPANLRLDILLSVHPSMR